MGSGIKVILAHLKLRQISYFRQVVIKFNNNNYNNITILMLGQWCGLQNYH